MAERNNWARILMLGLLCPALFAACTREMPTRSGALSDYRGLQPGEDCHIEATQPSGSGVFRAVEIVPVVFAVKEQTVSLESEVGQELAAVLKDSLVAEFADFPASDDAAAPVLRVRAVITGVNRSRPPLNLLTSLLLFVPVDNGGVSVEIEAYEKESGRQVAAMSAASNGTLLDFSGFFSRYGHARSGLQSVAGKFRQLLPENDQRVVGRSY